MSDYNITQARPKDLRLLAAIELAAARLLSGHAPAHVLNETTSEGELDDARRCGRLWVALAGDVPVGFAHVKVLEPTAAHLEEIDVHPETIEVSGCVSQPRDRGSNPRTGIPTLHPATSQ